MPEPEEGRTSGRRRPPIAVLFLIFFIGLSGFIRVTQKPQFESYRTMDVIQLLTAGACFGAALFGLMHRLLRPRF